MNLSRFIAGKIKGKGGIATLSVTVSIIIMIASISIATGFQKEIGAKATGFSGDVLFTVPGEPMTNDKYPLPLDISYLNMVENLKEVRQVSGVSYKPGILKTNNDLEGVFFKGVDSLYDLSFYSDHLTEGVLPDFSGRRASNDILISKRLADVLGYSTDDEIFAYFVGETPKVRKFRISGLYNIQLQEIDKTMTIVDRRHISQLNGWSPDEVSTIEVYLKGGADQVVMGRKIEDIMIEHSTMEDPSVIISPVKEHYSTLFDWLNMLDINVIVLLTLMIVVAGFNMISSLLIILIENISVIGVLKTLGMTNRAVSKVFLYKGASVVLRGVLFGNLIALTLLTLQDLFKIVKLNPVNYFISYAPVNLSIPTLLIINIISFLTLMIILLIPTVFISKVSPDRTIKAA